jgi:hypothetical protein
MRRTKPRRLGEVMVVDRQRGRGPFRRVPVIAKAILLRLS